MINLFERAKPVSLLLMSADFRNTLATTSRNGLALTAEFDVTFYRKVGRECPRLRHVLIGRN
ncbi:MAG: hypothetical protein ACOH2H_17175 [Cypionkella sp.]